MFEFFQPTRRLYCLYKNRSIFFKHILALISKKSNIQQKTWVFFLLFLNEDFVG